MSRWLNTNSYILIRMVFLAMFVFLNVSGCSHNGSTEMAKESMSEKNFEGVFRSLFVIYFIVSDYKENKNTWPDSLEELRAFCTEYGKQCTDVEWNRYKLQRLTEGEDSSVRIEYCPPNFPSPIVIHVSSGKSSDSLEQVLQNKHKEILKQVKEQRNN